MAQRCRDIRRGQAGGGHLVQQRLEQVMVAAVDQGDAGGIGGSAWHLRTEAACHVSARVDRRYSGSGNRP
ncbi:hypothetical protein G6F57_022903 [Rhizopus arrhizus]|nr:hypothetical protein G6F57_022903 [Rhizopus arrhizus]